MNKRETPLLHFIMVFQVIHCHKQRHNSFELQSDRSYSNLHFRFLTSIEVT